MFISTASSLFVPFQSFWGLKWPGGSPMSLKVLCSVWYQLFCLPIKGSPYNGLPPLPDVGESPSSDSSLVLLPTQASSFVASSKPLSDVALSSVLLLALSPQLFQAFLPLLLLPFLLLSLLFHHLLLFYLPSCFLPLQFLPCRYVPLSTESVYKGGTLA